MLRKFRHYANAHQCYLTRTLYALLQSALIMEIIAMSPELVQYEWMSGRIWKDLKGSESCLCYSLTNWFA